jgi:hypothetical protein
MPIGFHPGRGCDVYSLGPRPTFAPFGGAEIKLISIRLVSFRPSERCRDFIVSHSYKHLTPTGVRIAGTSNEFSLSLYHICHRIHQDVDHCFAVPLSLSLGIVQLSVSGLFSVKSNWVFGLHYWSSILAWKEQWKVVGAILIHGNDGQYRCPICFSLSLT